MTANEKKLVGILGEIVRAGYRSLGEGDTYAEVQPDLLKKAERIMSKVSKGAESSALTPSGDQGTDFVMNSDRSIWLEHPTAGILWIQLHPSGAGFWITYYRDNAEVNGPSNGQLYRMGEKP